MKTPEDIIATLTVGGYAKHGEYLYDASEIIDAMKEYAKQVVDKCYEDFGTTHDWAVTRDEIKKEIDAQ